MSQGNFFYLSKDYDGSKQKYLSAITADSSYDVAHSNLGLAYARLNDFTSAIASINQAISLAPGEKRHLLNLGKIYAMNEQYALAITAFSNAIGMDANYKEAFYNRGWCHDALGDFSSAISDYQQALSIDSHYSKAAMGMSISKAKQGLAYEAVWWCKNGMANSSGNAYNFNVIRQNLRTLRGENYPFNNESSIQIFKNGLSSLARERTADAEAWFAQLVSAESQSPLAHYAYSKALQANMTTNPSPNAEYETALNLLSANTFSSNPSGVALWLDFYGNMSTPNSQRLFPALYDVILKSTSNTYYTDTANVTSAGDTYLYEIGANPLDISQIVETDSNPVPNFIAPNHTSKIKFSQLMKTLLLYEFGVIGDADLTDNNVGIGNISGFFSGDELSLSGTLSTSDPDINVTKGTASGAVGDEYLEFLALPQLEGSSRTIDFTVSWTAVSFSGQFTFSIDYIPWDAFTLKYYANANGTIEGASLQAVYGGQSGAAVTAVPVAGYHFVEWSDGSTENPRTDSNVNENIAVSASFAINVYTVAFETDGTPGAILSGALSQTVNHGEDAAAVTAFAPAGYHFATWAKDGADFSSENPILISGVVSDMTLAAIFEFTTIWTVLANPSPIEGGTVSPSEAKVRDGQSIDLVATPAIGYSFVGWTAAPPENATISSSPSASTTATIKGDVVFTGTFSKYGNVVTMATYPNGAGTTVPEVGSLVVETGKPFEISAFPSEGYVFVGWQTEPSDNALIENPSVYTTTASVTENTTITALFSLAGTEILAGAAQFTSGYKESAKKGLLGSILMFRNRANLKIKLKTNMPGIDDTTEIYIQASDYSFRGAVRDAVAKKISSKAAMIKFKNSLSGEIVTIQWRAGQLSISVKLAPPANSDLNFFDLRNDVYKQTGKFPLQGVCPIWLSIGNRVFRNGDVSYSGNGVSKPNKAYGDDCVSWSVKGKGPVSEWIVGPNGIDPLSR